MTPKNSAWHEQREVKIGDYGEGLVKKFFEDKGYVCYQPESNGAHLCDFFIIKKHKIVTAAEVKTKPRRLKYPDTGIDIKHYERYKELTSENNMKMFIFFVDEIYGEIYGNYLHELDKPRISNGMAYPLEETTKYGQTIRYYPRDAMYLIRNLTSDEISELKRLRGVKS